MNEQTRTAAATETNKKCRADRMTLDETMSFSQPYARISRRALLFSLLLLFPTLGSAWMVPRSSNLGSSFGINDRVWATSTTTLWGEDSQMDRSRRTLLLQRTTQVASICAAALVAFTRPVWASPRSDEYSVKKHNKSGRNNSVRCSTAFFGKVTPNDPFSVF
jgi:hypothetical protein